MQAGVFQNLAATHRVIAYDQRGNGLSDKDTAEHEQIAAERARECVSRTLIYRVAPIDGPKPSEDEIQRRSKTCLADPQQDRYALAAVVRGRKYEAFTPAQAAAVTVPTLGIGGSLDSALTALQELRKLRPSVRFVVIDGASHAGATGAMRRAEFISEIRAFLAAQHRTN
jgi:pimeloyl-ACP methyl ester carboxylesterase